MATDPTSIALEDDPNITLDTSTKSFFDNDDISIGSSIHEMISSEITRKKERKSKSRERIRDLVRKKFKSSAHKDTDDPDIDNDVDLSMSSQNYLSDLDNSLCRPRSIMTVRTQEDSLRGGNVPEMRKLRRKVTIKIKSTDASCTTRSNSVRTSRSLSGSMDELSEASASTNSIDDVSLSFSNVYIREYQIIPGVNPAVSGGPPIELGWGHSETRTMDLDQYEGTRGNSRRLKMQMRMPLKVRKDLLLYHGSTKKMIKEATRTAKKHRWW